MYPRKGRTRTTPRLNGLRAGVCLALTLAVITSWQIARRWRNGDSQANAGRIRQASNPATG